MTKNVNIAIKIVNSVKKLLAQVVLQTCFLKSNANNIKNKFFNNVIKLFEVLIINFIQKNQYFKYLVVNYNGKIVFGRLQF